MALDGVEGVRYMYHDPCHTPMKTYAPLAVVNELMGAPVTRERALLRRVGDARHDAARHLDAGALPQGGGDAKGRAMRCAPTASRGAVKVLTSCPSCLQGLSRFDDDASTTADYIVVEIARHLLGPDWMADYVAKANRGGIERVLV